jgi:hypothetical protein
MAESKIRIKLGHIEVEYEGSETFLKDELSNLISTLSELKLSTILSHDIDDVVSTNKEVRNKAERIELSTNSIAAKLGVKTGPELAVAAAAHLTFVKEMKVFSRSELMKEMRTATSYFKETFGKNLTYTLSTLIKTKFNEPSNGKFALNADTEKELRDKLAS